MTLHFIGLGLGSIDDITLKGFKILRKCKYIYLESYTSIQTENLSLDISKMFPEAELIIGFREVVESQSDEILNKSIESDVAFLVVGDPFCATTHSDLVLRAKSKNIKCNYVLNASIISSVGCTGLQVYRFGQTVSIPFFDNDWKPSSFLHKIIDNYKMDLHSLVLLDIKVREKSLENMLKNIEIYEPSRFMTVNVALSQIEQINDQMLDLNHTLFVGLARIGFEDQIIKFGSFQKLLNYDFGKPPHSLIICAPNLDPIELELLNLYQ